MKTESNFATKVIAVHFCVMKVLKVKGDEKFSAVRWKPAMIKKRTVAAQ